MNPILLPSKTNRWLGGGTAESRGDAAPPGETPMPAGRAARNHLPAVARKVGPVAVILGLAAAAQLGILVAPGIVLSEAQAGTWVLFLSLMATLSAIGLCGTANAWAAAFSRPGAENVDWRAGLVRRARIGLPLTLAGLVAASLWFELSFPLVICLAVAVLAFQLKELLSTGLLRARRRYAQAAFMQKLWLFAVAAVTGIAWLAGVVRLELLVGVVAVVLVGNAVVAWRAAWRVSRPGGDAPDQGLDRLALGYWAITLSLLATRHADRLILTSVAGREATATYGMMVAILGGFELGIVALGHVLLPHCNGTREVRLGRLLGAVVALAATIALIYLVAGPWVVELVFRGKYAEGIPLQPLLISVGMVRMVGVVPGSLIGARLGPISLRLFSRVNIVVAVLTVGLLLVWVPRTGMWGSAWALLAGETLRTLAGLAIVWRWRDLLVKQTL